MKELKCVAGCKIYYGGEIKHHPDCPYYPESLSKMYDDLKREVKYLHNVINKRKQLKAFAEYCDREHGLFIPSWMIDNYENES